ncbi:BCL2/adenovirus E1B 19 kDa protein-interacting protein 3-like [Alligator mississippiensis]|uniref:BCL2/adenovirus E1B 19 kDa protein-interacting protein 3-like n=1 Tax=Alligator mississippiensis TaxID=8496 RepID=UPI002877D890|nr:BCL2/adenovirus E1B 19 kDa protein-interacting protein 3-like [Alligator mississippiensis]
MAGADDDEALLGSWVQLRGPGRGDAEPPPARACPHRHDVEQLLLEAQLEPGWGGPAADSPAPLPPPPPRDDADAQGDRPEVSALLGQERWLPVTRTRVQACASRPMHLSARTLALARPSLHGGAAGSKRRLFGSELLLLFVPSLLLSHLLTLGLGICIGKRLAAASASPL